MTIINLWEEIETGPPSQVLYATTWQGSVKIVKIGLFREDDV